MRHLLGLCALAATLTAQVSFDKRLVFSTYQGGDRNDDAQGVAVDATGNVYVIGESESRDFQGTPIGGKPLPAAVFRGYLTKYAPGGKKVLWRSLIGGSSNTVPHALSLDGAGNAYVAGTTGARDLPVKSAPQDKHAGLNIAFLMKFDPEGELLFSTFFGGERNDEANAVAIDSKGAIYIGGRTTSTNLPVKNALQPKMSDGGQDAFIAKYTPDYQLEYATYLGGNSGTDNIYSMAVGPDDSLYVTGESMSQSMATEGAYVTQVPSYSSYVARISPAGEALTYFTYVGWRGGYTKAQAITVDGQGRAVVVGHTTSKQLPVTDNAVQPNFAGGNRDAFLLRLAADGRSADYLTYLGGSFNGQVDPDETATAVKIDSRGFVYLTGETFSPDFVFERGLESRHAGVQDAYLTRLDLENGKVISSTFWGGMKKDVPTTLALGPGELVTFAGDTYSEDFPTSNAVQTKIGSANDSFVAQVCEPWLNATATPSFVYVIGGDKPGQLEMSVASGCPQAFDAEVAVDKPWLSVVADGRVVPMQLKLDVNVDGLEPGTHTATIQVTVPEAYPKTLTIPVTVTVTEPTKKEEDPKPEGDPVEAPAEEPEV